MKLRRRLRPLLIALLALPATTATRAAEPENLNAAAATVLGQNLRESFNTLRSTGLELDEKEFMRLVADVFAAQQIDTIARAEAEAAIRRAAGVAGMPDPVAPMDPEAEARWVKSRLELPRTEELDGGVVIQRIVEGSGPAPGPLDRVLVNYTGRLSSGFIFDVTDEPFELPLYNVVPGLRTALRNMRLGGTYRVFIPPMQAYGAEAVMDLIPAFSALDFTIEPLEIK